MQYDINENDLDVTTGDEGHTSEAPESAPEPAPQLYKYTAAGKEIEEPIETVLKRASQGYHYAQSMQDLKAQQQAFEQQRNEREEYYKGLENKWGQYESYAKENPQWAEHVRSQWENRQSFNGQQQGTQADYSNLPPEIQQKLARVDSLEQRFDNFFEEQRKAQEDAALDQQVNDVKKEYSDIDFTHSDPDTGKSLEFRIYEHMQTHGLNNFRAAFRDFYQDQLIARAVTQAKEEVSKNLQNRQQKGYIGESDTPTQGIKPAQRGSNRSYVQDILEGGRELGIL